MNDYYVSSGITISGVTLQGFGGTPSFMFVSGGGRANHTTVNSLGTIFVSSGGIVDGVMVNSGGGMGISSGGIAMNVRTDSNSAVEVLGLLLSAYISGGDQNIVSSGGIISSSIVVDGAALVVWDGGKAKDIVVSGADPNCATTDNSGIFLIGGYAENVTANCGGWIMNNGTVKNALIESGGSVSTEGTLTGQITIEAGANVSVFEGAIFDFDISEVAPGTGARINNLSLFTEWTNANFTLTVSDSQEKGTYTLAEGAAEFNKTITVQNTLGESLGTLSVGQTIKLGEMDYTLNLTNGTISLSVSDSVIVPPTPEVEPERIIENEIVTVNEGEVFSNTTINSGGQLHVSSGGIANDVAINNVGGLYVFSGGTASATKVNSGGGLYVYDGGIVTGIELVNGAACQVLAGGSASNFRVQSGANLIVRSGGTAYNILEDGGIVTVMDGAVATFADRIVSDTVLTDGTMSIHSGTTMVNTVIGQNGKLIIIDGGRAEKNTVNACVPDGGLVLYNNTVAIGNTMNDSGFTYIFSGGTAIDNTINSGGSMTLLSGAVMKNVDVMSGGKLYMSSGSILTGRVRINTETGYIFIDDYGCTIDFDVSEINPSGDAEPLLDDYNQIRSEPREANYKADFTLTVAPDQSLGTYVLGIARKNPDYFPTFTVKTTENNVLGTLSQSQSVMVNGVEYRLSIEIVIDTATQTGIATMLLHVGDNYSGNGPGQPVTSADVTAPTNGCVTVTASFDASTATKQYSFDATNWMEYSDGIVLRENGRVYFRGLNSSGAASRIASYTVKNIDKITPDKPTASADVTKPTNGNVMVTAVFSEDSVVQQYSLDNQNWNEYKTAIEFEQNGTVYFRGKDEAGKYSTVTSYTVDNIDKTPPTKPVAVPSSTESTNQDVTVTATFSDDSVVKESSLDGENWTTYFGAVTFTENGVVYFRATDAVGNVSDITSYEVTNIDKIAPATPTASADITTPTNQPVTVTAIFDEDTTVKEYSSDGLVWTKFDGSVQVEENVKLYFRGKDAAGNVSEISAYIVNNIDKIAPVKPTVSADITVPTNKDVTVTAVFSEDSVKKEYSLDGETWNDYSEGIVFTENGTVMFRGTAEAGNESEIASYTVSKTNNISGLIL